MFSCRAASCDALTMLPGAALLRRGSSVARIHAGNVDVDQHVLAAKHRPADPGELNLVVETLLPDRRLFSSLRFSRSVGHRYVPSIVASSMWRQALRKGSR